MFVRPKMGCVRAKIGLTGQFDQRQLGNYLQPCVWENYLQLQWMKNGHNNNLCSYCRWSLSALVVKNAMTGADPFTWGIFSFVFPVFFLFSHPMLPHLEDFMLVHLVEPFLHPVVLFLDLILEQSHHMQPHIHGVTSHPLELAMYPPTKHLIIHQGKNMWWVSYFIFFFLLFFHSWITCYWGGF